MTDPSPPYTVTMNGGVQDILKTISDTLAGQQSDVLAGAGADDYPQLCDAQRQLIIRLGSYIGCLTRILTTTGYDGDEIHILPEFVELSLFFRYVKSGLHGGMIHTSQGWSIHT